MSDPKYNTMIDHGGFMHPAPQDFNCEACRKGIGHEVRKLKPMYDPKHESATAFGFMADRRGNKEP